ncbi:MAG: DNA-binding protein WhiA [Ruminococcaceae bacterium]|nr:DNA-binding protein WhiA [Oscillospiraceae bacterium]
MSFSHRVKQDIVNLKFKNKCCKKAFIYGALMSASLTENALSVKLSDSETSDFITYILNTVFKIKEIDITEVNRGFCSLTTLQFYLPTAMSLLSDIDEARDTSASLGEIFACQSCVSYFFCGLFCSCGTVSDPEKSYSLEISLPNRQRADKVKELFDSRTDLRPGIRKRKNNGYGLFFRNSDSVSGFLTLCQLSTAVFDFFNQQFNNQLRGEENRATNCDARNIMRSVNAASKHIQAIEKLQACGRLAALSEDLRQTAALRIEHSDMSLSDLARVHNPPITKSGLNHRLSRLLAEAEEI